MWDYFVVRLRGCFSFDNYFRAFINVTADDLCELSVARTEPHFDRLDGFAVFDPYVRRARTRAIASAEELRGGRMALSGRGRAILCGPPAERRIGCQQIVLMTSDVELESGGKIRKQSGVRLFDAYDRGVEYDILATRRVQTDF